MKNMMKKIEVMMVKKEEIDGKVVRVIKQVEMDEDVVSYLELGGSEKVKEAVKKKIKDGKVFGMYDVNELWYKWDDFLSTWRKERMKYMKVKKMDEAEVE